MFELKRADRNREKHVIDLHEMHMNGPHVPFPGNEPSSSPVFNPNVGTQPEPNLHNFSTGARRSTDADDVRLDLICPTGLLRLAKIYNEGAVKYGDTNYTKGIPIANLLNHGEKHLALWKSGDRSEDHLAKVAWAMFSAMHMNSNCKHHMTIIGNQDADLEYTTLQKVLVPIR
jgi:hypothetical protein